MMYTMGGVPVSLRWIGLVGFLGVWSPCRLLIAQSTPASSPRELVPLADEKTSSSPGSVSPLASLPFVLSEKPPLSETADLDFAQEADIRFRLAARFYQQGDLEQALLNFVASNRLSPNHNVVFNIARCYEQLRRYPEAFRYYTKALEGESDQAKKQKIMEALEGLLPQIAVVRVDSNPPGASLYVDRKDLGMYGKTPNLFAFAPGSTPKLFLELPGYEPTVQELTNLEKGSDTPMRVVLEPIVGQVDLQGDPVAVEVRVDSKATAPLCHAPCSLSLPLGSHRLFFTKEGFGASEVAVTVDKKGAHIPIAYRLVPFVGSLVVHSNVRDARIEVDGTPMGFTPTALRVPMGAHRVVVTQDGFQSVERDVQVDTADPFLLEVELQPSYEVAAASRMTQSVEEAPASVTILSREELRSMAYPTLADALRGTRGLFLNDDRRYLSLGVRGFSESGGYGNRVLVLLDGQPTNDDYVGRSCIGVGSLTEMQDVERVEIIRGPGSVYYGTGAVGGVINLITRNRYAPTHGEASLSTFGDGMGRLRSAFQLRLSPESGIWTSIGGLHRGGQIFALPNDSPQKEKEIETQSWSGRAWYKALALQWSFIQWKKTVPVSQEESPNRFEDLRGFASLSFEPTLSDKTRLFARMYSSLYTNRIAHQDGPTQSKEFNLFLGRWVGLEQRLVWSPFDALDVTVGGEGQYHFAVDQTRYDKAGTASTRSDPFSLVAAYLLGDITPTHSVKISAGVRFDLYSNAGAAWNPRLAVILRPYAEGTLKLIAGSAFRAPSVYELSFESATHAIKTQLKPEHVYSGEVEFNHRLTPEWGATVATYVNSVKDLIVLRGEKAAGEVNFFDNKQGTQVYFGGEVEVRREGKGGWFFSTSYSHQQAVAFGGTHNRTPWNIPPHLFSVKGGVPVAANYKLSTRISMEGARMYRLEVDKNPQEQGSTEPYVLWDIVLTGKAEHFPVGYAVGLYNALDWRYSFPAGLAQRSLSISQSGRTLLASAEIRW